MLAVILLGSSFSPNPAKNMTENPKKRNSNNVNAALLIGLTISIMVIFFISKRFPFATELVVPIIGISILFSRLIFLILVAKGKLAKIIWDLEDIILIITANTVYFFTSQYKIALGGRTLLYINLISQNFIPASYLAKRNLNTDKFYYWIVLVLWMVFFEFHSYIMNEERVRAFLSKY